MALIAEPSGKPNNDTVAAETPPLVVETITPEQLLQRIDALLEKNRGVFIGEKHSHLLAPMLMARSAEDWQKRGVSTLYGEMDMHAAQAMLVGEDCLKGKAGIDTDKPLNHNLLGTKIAMDNAAAAGMRVIGHDPINITADMIAKMKDPEFLARVATGGAAMDARDDFAVALINATYDGKKFIVYGGLAHGISDLRSPEGAHYERPSKTSLPQRLGIPSISFEKPLPREFSIDLFIDPPQRSQAEVMRLQNEARAENRQSPVLITAGQDKGSLRVTSYDEFAFVGVTTAVESPEGKARLKEVADKARAAGACSAPAHLTGRDVLSGEDIENLARNLKKPAPSKSDEQVRQ